MAQRSWQPPAVFNFAATLLTLAAAVGLAWLAWAYYEYTPWTRDGRIRVYTVRVAPEVSGTVVALPVHDLKYVHKGDLLFQIDPGTYANDVKRATGQLAQARAQASYLDAEARRQAALPDIAASAQQKQNSFGIALGAQDAVLAETAALDQASLNLRRTTVRSPVDGWVSDLLLQQGGYAETGQPAMTLVNADSFWAVGYFEETQLARIKDGDVVRLTLMAYPGHPVTGHVEGLSHGIQVTDAQPGVQGLPSVNPVFTWVRLAQRIPVRIVLDNVPCPIVLAAGMTATVSILDHPSPATAGARRTGAKAALACDTATASGHRALAMAPD
nr:HlyD family secretion protein [uncultured Lichenicoccus sp.]